MQPKKKKKNEGQPCGKFPAFLPLRKINNPGEKKHRRNDNDSSGTLALGLLAGADSMGTQRCLVPFLGCGLLLPLAMGTRANLNSELLVATGHSGVPVVWQPPVVTSANLSGAKCPCSSSSRPPTTSCTGSSSSFM